MLFCPANQTFDVPWIHHGMNMCNIETVSSVFLASYLLIFGFGQFWYYRKYAAPITEAVNAAPRRKLYSLQKFLLVFVPMLATVRVILKAYFYEDAALYGFMLLSVGLTWFSYLTVLSLIRLERYNLLPSLPVRGHQIVLLIFFTLAFAAENLSFMNVRSEDWWFHFKSATDRAEMALFVLRYISTLLIFVLGMKAPGIISHIPEDAQNFINNDQPETENQSTFRNAWRKLSKLAPFIWPKYDTMSQLNVILCIGLLIAGRVINLYVPIYNKRIVDSLSGEQTSFRWDWILIYVLFKFLQGGGTGSMGLLNNLRTYLWIRVNQYTTREIEVELFRHLHSLSLAWHLKRKTGEVLRVMDRGTDSINNLLNYILFSIVPTLVDIAIAVIFFITMFNWWFGLIVFSSMILYMVATILVTEWRTQYQRKMNLANNAQNARSVDSLLNFETVKYYGAEQYEVEKFREAIKTYQTEEWKTLVTLNILNTMQNIIITVGLLAGSLLCAWMVYQKDQLTVGDYVLFASYIIQLYVPLNWFGTYYRQIQKNFIDMENMFDLMHEEQEVIDAPNAGPLVIARGGIEFNNVTFGYSPEKLVLRNVSFNVMPGKTVAFVGPSGAGKSTIVRLIFRFYDVTDGAILIDGQNIKTVTQESLRQAIGVVPQDTVLFNNTIMYNIQYGRISAPEGDIIAAAKSADVHDRILSFPNQYETEVGERGLRLSGGEKQRVAIARTILKAPAIVLLDEATSALDTRTERNIQAALNQVCADRTTLIVAHRLSTIIHADEICVLKDGIIVERGTHEDLLMMGAVYADMWQQQLQNLEVDKKPKADEPVAEKSTSRMPPHHHHHH